MYRKSIFVIFLILVAGMQTACKKNNPSEQNDINMLVDKVWTFSLSHPDGFTLDIRTMTEPTEGIAVSYAATQGSHSREQLPEVITHALEHDGYVGGWYSTSEDLYYFDSTRLFPEDSLSAARAFGKDNGQYSVFILSTGTEVAIK